MRTCKRCQSGVSRITMPMSRAAKKPKKSCAVTGVGSIGLVRADFDNGDLAYALDNAAEFLENEEWPDDDGGVQEAANKEAAKRIRRMSKRLPP